MFYIRRVNAFSKILFTLLIIAFSCRREHKAFLTEQGDISANRFAKGFEIIKTNDLVRLHIKKPFQNAENEKQEYMICQKPSGAQGMNIFHTPVKRVVCMSTTYLPFIKALGQENSVVGISGSRLVYDSLWKKKIENGEIAEVGYEQSLNYELLIALRPDVVFVYGVGYETSLPMQKLVSLGIKPVFISEYMENQPLAKTEWIKVFGLFYNSSDKATAIFDSVSTLYIQLAGIIETLSYRPEVFCGLPYKDTWYVSGGNTYISRFIADAGGDYIFSYVNNDVAAMNTEQVFSVAAKTAIWINCGTVNTLKELEMCDKRMKLFSAYKNRQVFNNNKRSNETGGNDYWESGILNPDRILGDLINIFHPGILQDTSLYYYKRIY